MKKKTTILATEKLLLISLFISCSLISSVPPRSILYADSNKIYAESLAQKNYNARYSKFWLAHPNSCTCCLQTCYVCNKKSDFMKEEQRLQADINTVICTLAKQYDACAVETFCGYSSHPYINPEHIITDVVINQLNKLYTAELIQTKNTSPQEVLYEAILNDSSEGIQEAILAGADANQIRSEESLLFWAISFKKSIAVSCLLEHDAKADASLIQFAVTQGDCKSAILLAKQCKVNLDDVYTFGGNKGSLLEFAASYSDFESVFSLIKSGAHISGDTLMRFHNRTLMECIAIWGGSDSKPIILELVQELLNGGYNVNNIWALETGAIYRPENNKLLRLFIKNGANPNHSFKIAGGCRFWTPLIKAIDIGNGIQAVQILIEAGANINQKSDTYYESGPHHLRGTHTPLSYAIAHQSQGTVDILLKHGAKR
jgi:hypothetical protein